MKITWQRCFSVAESKLSLFLVRLDAVSDLQQRYVAEFIFEKHDRYDVVVTCYGEANPLRTAHIEKFAREIEPRKTGEL
jgi:hypothetical protein